MADAEGVPPVERREVHGHALRGHVGEGAQHRRDARLPRHADAPGREAPPGEDAGDHPRAGGAGPRLEEKAGPVGVGRLDDAGEVEGVEGLPRDRVGGALPVGLVGPAPGPGVEAHPRRRRRLHAVEVAVGLLHLAHHLAVDRGDAAHGMERGPEVLHEGLDLPAGAADDALLRRVHDEEVDAAPPGQGAAHGIGLAVHDPDHPVHRLVGPEPPALARRVAGPREVAGEERRVPHRTVHPVPVGPRAEGEEARGLAEAVAEDRRRARPEGAQQIAHHGLQRDLAEDERPVVPLDVLAGSGVPEGVGGELPPEVEGARVLGAEDLGPGDAEVAAHAREVVPRAGEDEGELAPEGLGGEEDAVAAAAPRGGHPVPLAARAAALAGRLDRRPAEGEELLAAAGHDGGGEGAPRVRGREAEPAAREGLDPARGPGPGKRLELR